MLRGGISRCVGGRCLACLRLYAHSHRLNAVCLLWLLQGRIITLQTEAQAEEVYKDAQEYIKTITRLELVASNHINVDGQLFADAASRSFFYRAFRDTGPQIEVLVLKIPRSPSAHPDFTDAAEHELMMYKKLEVRRPQFVLHLCLGSSPS